MKFETLGEVRERLDDQGASGQPVPLDRVFFFSGSESQVVRTGVPMWGVGPDNVVIGSLQESRDGGLTWSDYLGRAPIVDKATPCISTPMALDSDPEVTTEHLAQLKAGAD